MDFWRKTILVISIVLYVMSVGNFINCLFKVRYYKLKNKSFLKEKGNSYLLNEDEERYWKNQQERYVVVPVTLFLAFFVSATIFSVMVFVLK